MSNLLIIRSIAHTDFEKWLSLWQGYNLFYGRPSISKEITQTTWLRFFDTNEPVHAIVAEKNGQLLGLAHYLFHRSTTQIELSCYLQDLFTSHEARNHSVGKALIEAVYERARAVGSPQVYWHTQDSNIVARSLYNKVAKLTNFILYQNEITQI